MRSFGERDPFAAVQRHVGDEGAVLPFPVARLQAEQGRAGARLQRERGRRMVLVRVGDEDAVDRPGRGGDDRIDVSVERRPRIDHRPALGVRAADQIRVGARPGHDAAVVGGDADDALGEAHRAVGDELVRRIAVAGRIDAAELGPGILVGHHRPKAVAAARRRAASRARPGAAPTPRPSPRRRLRSGRSSRASSASASAASATPCARAPPSARSTSARAARRRRGQRSAPSARRR